MPGSVLAALLTIGAFGARVAVDFTGAGDAAVMQLLCAMVSFFGGDVSLAAKPVLVGLVEAVAAGVVGGGIAIAASRYSTWRNALFVILILTLLLQLLLAAVPVRVG